MKLHLGCGERYLKGYVNIDFPPSAHTVQKNTVADIVSDIQKLKYPADSIDEIRLHHVFEHFPRVVACRLLATWHIWLKNEGLLRIEVPDFSKMAMQILNPHSSEKKKLVAQRHIFGSQEAKWAVHFTGYSKESLIDLLERYRFKIGRIKKNSWKDTSNIEVFATKKKQDISITEFKKITRDYLSLFLLDNSPSEQRLLSVWMTNYEKK
jgi:predicted SAM-dependent methyltransferase